jgi:hypothetical protein
MGTVGGIRGVVAHAVGQQAKAQGQPSQQQQQPNTLPLEVWLVNILPLTPLRDLLPLCSTSKWLGDELKHDVVIKAALARRGHGKRFMSASSFVRLCYFMHFVIYIRRGPIPLRQFGAM